MTTPPLEIEVKLYVPELTFVETRLQALGAILTHPRIFERNLRYENVGNTLEENKIVLRLRQDTKAWLTYKEPAPEGSPTETDGMTIRSEAEVEVSDFDTMHLILTRLGYHVYVIYEKYRTTYTLDDAEIVLDELPYGNFVEIEGQPETIRRVIERLELGQATRYKANYLALFNRVRYHLGLTFRDLTFDNLSGVHIPQSAFDPPYNSA